MARKKVGLALGAGAARGFAHIGVLQTLEEYSIPIDFIAGSSMGAVIGGIYACGTDLTMLNKIVPVLREKDYLDVEVPKHGGFLRGERFQNLIQIFTKRYSFDQTKIPFQCTAVDIMTGELVVLKDGVLDEAIRASIAMPAIIRPHMLEGRTLIDGGVISRVPATIAREMGADIVIGVDVGYRGEHRNEPPVSLVDYLLAANDIMSWQIAKGHDSDADLLLVPAVRLCDPNSVKDYECCVEMGRNAAEEAIPQILKLIGKRAKTTTLTPSEKKSKTTVKRKK